MVKPNYAYEKRQKDNAKKKKKEEKRLRKAEEKAERSPENKLQPPIEQPPIDEKQ